MLGSTPMSAVLGAGVNNRDPEAVRAFVRSAADVGLSLLFIAPESKVPVDLRTPQQKTKDNKAAQEAAKEAGRRDWRTAKSPAGLALATSDKTVLDRYLKKYLSLYADRYPDGVPVNIAAEVGGSGLIVVDCDTAAQMERFYQAALPEGFPVEDRPAPTVVTPGHRGAGADDEDSTTWAHSNGGHFYFTVPDTLMPTLPRNLGAMTWGGDDGFAVLWDKRYVLIPPSTRPEGAYELLGRDYEVEDWLVEKIVEAAARRVERSERNNERGDDVSERDQLIDEWAEDTPWSLILEPMGWTPAPRADSCGCPVWTAPGVHANPKSATAHDSGCSLGRYTNVNAPLHIWTDNPAEPFDEWVREKGTSTITKLQAVALVNYGGGVGAAMDDLGLTPDLAVDGDPDIAPRAQREDPDHGMVGDGDFEMPTAVKDMFAPLADYTHNQISAAGQELGLSTFHDEWRDDHVVEVARYLDGQGCVVCQSSGGLFVRDPDDGSLWHATDEDDAAETGGHPASDGDTITSMVSQAKREEPAVADDAGELEPQPISVSSDPADLPADFGKKPRSEIAGTSQSTRSDDASPYHGGDDTDHDPDVFDSKHAGVPRCAPFSHWRDMPPPEYVIHGLLEHGGLSCLIGPPGAGKSTIALDMACHIATGKRWHGRLTLKTKVLYLPGEGLSGAVQRIAAWEDAHGIDLGNDLLLGDSIILVQASNESWGDIAAYIARQGVGLVIFDTFARMSSGLEENSATDVGKAVRRFDKLKELTSAGVLVVHHSGKGDPSVARGSSALNGALDSELLVRAATWDTTQIIGDDGRMPGKAIEVWTTKQKNAEQLEEAVPLLMISHDLGHNISAPIITGPNGFVDPMQGEIVLARPRPEPIVETAIKIRHYVDNLPKQGATRAELVVAVRPDAYAMSRKDTAVYWKQRIAEAVDRGLAYDLIETLTGTAAGQRYIPSFATAESARTAAAAAITAAE